MAVKNVEMTSAEFLYVLTHAISFSVYLRT